VVNAL
jgi:hypothetical protein